jgi:hypothetical protein
MPNSNTIQLLSQMFHLDMLRLSSVTFPVFCLNADDPTLLRNATAFRHDRQRFDKTEFETRHHWCILEGGVFKCLIFLINFFRPEDNQDF